MDRITSGPQSTAGRVNEGIQHVDNELLDALWDLYERRFLDLRKFEDHPAYDTARAQVKAQRIGIAMNSPELMHYLGVFTQTRWLRPDLDGSLSDLYRLIDVLRYPDLGT